MKAIVIKKFVEQPVLDLADLSVPIVKAYEVRIKTKAIGVNQADILQAKGKYAAPPGFPPDIPGLEFAGVVDEIGYGVEKFKIGDRVLGLTGGGSYAEQLTIHADCISKIPDNISFVEAAAIPEAFITAYDALISQGQLSMGECLLIHAVGSGVGLAALQIAKNIGATVIGTSRSKDKLKKAEALGLDYSLLVEDGKFAQAVKNICSPNIILELVGGNYLVEDIDCIALQGRIILVGLLAGRTTNIDLGKILTKRVLLKGTTLRARPLAEKILVNEKLEKNILPLFKTNKMKAIVDKTFHLSETKKAFEYISSNANFGKVILTCE